MTDIKIEIELLAIDRLAGVPLSEGDLARGLKAALGGDADRYNEHIADAVAVAISNAVEMAAK